MTTLVFVTFGSVAAAVAANRAPINNIFTLRVNYIFCFLRRPFRCGPLGREKALVFSPDPGPFRLRPLAEVRTVVPRTGQGRHALNVIVLAPAAQLFRANQMAWLGLLGPIPRRLAL